MKNAFKTGNGKLFSVCLNDKSGSIDMKFFNQIADVFYPQIEVSIFVISFLRLYQL